MNEEIEIFNPDIAPTKPSMINMYGEILTDK